MIHPTDEFALAPARAQELLKELGAQTCRQYLETMYTIRAFEEKAEELYGLGKVHGTMHLSIGQEASAVGASNAVRKGYDYLLNHHRGHGHCIAWGSDINKMMAEFMGREDGFCRGRGGSMHIADMERNNLGAQGIVGGSAPISVGVGLSIQLRKTDQICLVIFGDGATNEGAFHESANMASIWKLPIVFLCENNQYGMSMSVQRSMNVKNIAERAAAYNIPARTYDGNDVLAVIDAVKWAADHARSGQGPVLLEAKTYRWRGHSKSDRQLYRTREELKEWQNMDPIPRFAARMIEAGYVTKEDVENIRTRGYETIDQSVAFAEHSPEPDVATLMEGIYAE